MTIKDHEQIFNNYGSVYHKLFYNISYSVYWNKFQICLTIKSQTEYFISPVDEYLCLSEESRNGKEKNDRHKHIHSYITLKIEVL